MEQENENQPPPLETQSAPPEQRRRRSRRGYGRRRYYNRGNRNDNFDASNQENSGSDHSGAADDAGGGVEVSDRPVTAETENGEQTQAEPEFGEGIIEISGKGFGFLRDPKRNFVQTPQDIFVTPEIVRRFGLRDGMWIHGETRRGSRGPQLTKLLTINGGEPGQVSGAAPV